MKHFNRLSPFGILPFIFVIPFLASCGGGSQPGTGVSNAPEELVKDYSLNYYEDRKGFMIEDYRGNASSISIPSEATLDGIAAPIVGISDYAFANRSVQDMYLPESIHYIGAYAFHQSKLRNLYVTPYLTTLDRHALYNCDVNFNEKDGVRYLPNRKGLYGYAMSYYGDGNAEITLPDECEAVYDYVFTKSNKINVGPAMKGFGSIGHGCKYVFASSPKQLTVTKVGDCSLSKQSDLVSVTIEGCATTIGYNAFFDCLSLASVTICSGVTSIGSHAFEGCSSLISVTIPDSVTSIGELAFSVCSSLTSIIIGNSVTSIYEGAFSNCSSLTSVTIPDSVTSIGEGIFKNCSSLSSIIVDSSNPVYDSRDGCNAIIETAKNELVAGCKSTNIPDSVTSIGDYAFAYCRPLISVVIPDSVTSIGDYAFAYCDSLTSITIPDSVVSIGRHAFWDCRSLTSIIIPKSVDTIGLSAFDGPATIYCEASSKPDGWDYDWCSSDCRVVWGYQGN